MVLIDGVLIPIVEVLGARAANIVLRGTPVPGDRKTTDCSPVQTQYVQLVFRWQKPVIGGSDDKGIA
jgi:hypothetical protein